MTFAISNTTCPPHPFSKIDSATLLLDFLGVATIVTVVCLTVIAKINLGISGTVGTISNPYIQMLLVAGGLVFCSDLIVAVLKCKATPVVEDVPKAKKTTMSKKDEVIALFKDLGCSLTLQNGYPIIETQTKKILGQKLGGGHNGAVFQLASHPHFAIKKLSTDLERDEIEREFYLGTKLQHPTICKTYALIQMTESVPSSDDSDDEYEEINRLLVMDLIDGTKVADYDRRFFNGDIFCKLTEQAKHCCLYLFDHNVCWADVNGKNAMITKSHDLRIFDLGQWYQEDNLLKLAQNLFLNGMTLLEALVAIVSIDQSMQRQIFKSDTESNITAQMIGKSREELRLILADYFDTVIQAMPKPTHSNR